MNIQKMLKQAQQMQAKMAQAQEELAQKTVEAVAAGDKVKVVANGNGDVISIQIDPSIVDPEDVEFLQDLILTTVQKAVESGKELAAQEMSKLTGGMSLPGMPF